MEVKGGDESTNEEYTHHITLHSMRDKIIIATKYELSQ